VSERIEFNVLRVPSGDVIGDLKPLRISPLTAEAFTSPNACGEIRAVEDINEVREIGNAAAEQLIKVFSA